MAAVIVWQKSSYSGGGDSSDCVELATVNRTVRLRESDAPTCVLTAALAALIRGVRHTPRP